MVILLFINCFHPCHCCFFRYFHNFPACAFLFHFFVRQLFFFIVAVICFHLDLSKPHTDAYTQAMPFQSSEDRINKIHCEHCYCYWHIIYCWFILYNHHNQLQQLICTSKWIEAIRGKCVSSLSPAPEPDPVWLQRNKSQLYSQIIYIHA